MPTTNTITSAALADLHRGCASLAIKSYTSAGVADFGTLDFHSDDLLFSLKDSFDIASTEASTQDITIDQGNQVIDTDTTSAAEQTISLDFPTVAADALAKFFNAAGAVTVNGAKSGSNTSYTSATAYFNTVKETEVTLAAESASKKTMIVWAHIKFSAVLAKGDNNITVIRLTGKVLANAASGVGDFCVYKAAA